MSKRPKLNLQERYGLFIDGEFVDAANGETIKVTSPADGSFLAEIAAASEADVDKAQKAGEKAFKEYRTWTRQERAAMLNKIADVIDENLEHLALVETMDNGKPIRESKTHDLPMAAEHFRFFAGLIETEKGSLRKINNDVLSLVWHEPYGVVGQVVPWNLPLLMAAWKLAPALAAGNTVVIKPSSSTSLSLLELMRLTKDIIPAGVVNVVTGSGSTAGDAVLKHPGFKKLGFTGSTEVGYSVAKQAADRLIPSTLELGGKSANIIFNDANLDEAVDGTLMGILFNQGEVCSAGSRVYVQEDIYDEYIERTKRAFEKVKAGMPWEEDTQIGAEVNENQCKKVNGFVERAKEEGATIVTGGERLTTGEFGEGVYFPPTLITDAAQDSEIAREEIFGPVVVVMKFKDESEVIDLANDSEYGLGGGVFTKDISRALRVASAMETGRVWINCYDLLPEGAPFGGYKKSGIGRENDEHAFEAYSQVKNVMIDISDAPSGLYDLD